MAEFERDNAGNSEAQQKQALAYLFAQSSPGVAATGVLAGLAVSQTTTASGSVLVAPGAAVVQASATAGVSELVNDTAKTLDVLTENPVGALPRNDVVVFDAAIPGLRAIVGSPNATPADPTVPATTVALARLRHAADATTIPAAKIDQLHVATSLAGAGDRFHPDVITGATAAAGATVGVSAGVSIAASAVRRLVRGSFGATPSSGTGGELQVYRDGAPIRKVSGLAAGDGRGGSYQFVLNAGASTVLGLVVVAGPDAMNLAGDPLYVYHEVSTSYLIG